MDRKLGGVALIALCLPTPAHSLELLCEGETAIGGQVGTTSFVFNRDEKTGGTKIWTPEGDAYGATDETQQHFRGALRTESGSTFSMALDRYSGSLFVIRMDPPAEQSKAAFWGTCATASRKF